MKLEFSLYKRNYGYATLDTQVDLVNDSRLLGRRILEIFSANTQLLDI